MKISFHVYRPGNFESVGIFSNCNIHSHHDHCLPFEGETTVVSVAFSAFSIRWQSCNLSNILSYLSCPKMRGKKSFISILRLHPRYRWETVRGIKNLVLWAWLNFFSLLINSKATHLTDTDCVGSTRKRYSENSCCGTFEAEHPKKC